MVSKIEDWGGSHLNNWEMHYKGFMVPSFDNAITITHHNNRGLVVGTCIRWIDGHLDGKVHQNGKDQTK